MNDKRLPTLYHFPISHFSEKARWAFDYKGIAYRSKVLLPGPHRLTLRNLRAGLKTVPVAAWDSEVVSGSECIIDELDRRYVERSLTPADPVLHEETRQWESMLDQDIGVRARRIFYFHAFKYPGFVVPLYTHGGPWWGRAFYTLFFGRVVTAVNHMYQINAANVAQDWKQLVGALERVERRLESREFLVGESFSRADLTLAALCGPVLGQQTGLEVWPPDEEWPAEVSDAFAAIRETPVLRRVAELYRDYRKPVAG